MNIVIEEIDGAFYSDLILSPAELKRLRQGEMLEGQTIYRRRRCYIGIRLQGLWDYEEEDIPEGEE